jgi:ABC-type Na+ efflux pump permease subunit
MSNPFTTILRSVFAWPLIKRELVSLLRTRRAFWLLFTSVIVSCALPLSQWPSESQSISFFDENLVVFMMFVISQLLGALLIVPAFTAGAIAGERERETYELLYSTLLSPSSIVISKFIASLSYVLLLLLASAPLGCLLFMLGGIDFSTLMKCYAVVFASVLSSGIVCLAVSMRCNRTTHAAIRGYVWVAFWNGGLYLVLGLGLQLLLMGAHEFGGDLMPSDDQAIEQTIVLSSGLCPVPVLAGLVFGEWFSMTRFPTLWVPVWVVHVSYCGLISIAHFAYLLRRVRTPNAPVSRRKERLRAKRGRSSIRRRPRLAFTTRAILDHGERRFLLFGNPFANPVLRKELRAEFVGRAWYRRLVFWIPLALFLAIATASLWSWFSANFIVIFAVAAITLIVPGAAATCVTKEIEQGNFDLLRGTLVPMPRILFGKLLGATFSGLGITFAAVWALLAVFLFADDQWIHGVQSYRDSKQTPEIGSIAKISVVLLVTTLALSCLGVLFSVTSRRSMSALVKTYASTAVGFILVPFFFALLQSGHDGDGATVATSPFATCIWILEENYQRSPVSEEVGVFALFLVFYSIGCGALWAIALRFFCDPRHHR